MTGLNVNWLKRAISMCLLLLIWSWGLTSCAERPDSNSASSNRVTTTAKISEVAPPPVINELRQSLEQYQPQVSIVSPQPDQVFGDTTVSVQLQIRDLPIFKNQELEMGPHLHLILDNQPYRAVYDVEEPIVFDELSPGTHSLRVFASRPWHESFKNEGAYAQTTFHIFTKTDENQPDSSLPLLTYSRPKGTYGAEPIMLDFYLNNAPLHLVAQENPEDDIADWKIRVTVNGESFLLDSWQPIYLKGFQSGQNWVQLEFLDEQGNKVSNAFNDTVRLITYKPKGQDTLSKLVRGELTAQAVHGIVPRSPTGAIAPLEEPLFKAPALEEPFEEQEPIAPETPLEEPALEEPFEEPALEAPVLKEPPVEEPVIPETPAEAPAPEIDIPSVITEPEQPIQEPVLEPAPAKPAPAKPFQRIFNRFRRPAISPNPSPEPLLPEVVAPEPPEIEPELNEPEPELYIPIEPYTDAQTKADSIEQQSAEQNAANLEENEFVDIN